MTRILLPALALLATACAPTGTPAPQAAASPLPAGETRTAVFAGGCFWCMEKPFDDLPGVVATTSGFSGGLVANPSYDLVTQGATGHVEVVQVTYDPAQVSFARLLEVYWRQVDPFDPDGQFCDQGSMYRPAIFVADEAERTAALASKQAVEAQLKAPVVVAIEPAKPFYAAEAYHQDYYKKNPVRYRYYRNACGRDGRLAQVWGR
jgi:peptide-methionine (S)-S-oxide reductase